MSLRPKAIAAWRNLTRTIRANMNMRRYELVTLAAAVTMKCTSHFLSTGSARVYAG